MHHPRRRNVTTSMDGLKKKKKKKKKKERKEKEKPGHIRKNPPKHGEPQKYSWERRRSTYTGDQHSVDRRLVIWYLNGERTRHWNFRFLHIISSCFLLRRLTELSLRLSVFYFDVNVCQRTDMFSGDGRLYALLIL